MFIRTRGVNSFALENIMATLIKRMKYKAFDGYVTKEGKETGRG